MGNLTGASKSLGNPNIQAVDVPVASLALRRFTIDLSANAAMVVQNASRYLTAIVSAPAGIKVVGARAVFAITIPAQSGGAATVSVRSLADSDGTTFTDIVTAVTVLTGFSQGIPIALTLAAANPTNIPLNDTLVVTVTANNNAVGTADVGFGLTLYCEAAEPDPIISA